MEQIVNELYKKGLVDSANIREDDFFKIGYVIKAYINENDEENISYRESCNKLEKFAKAWQKKLINYNYLLSFDPVGWNHEDEVYVFIFHLKDLFTMRVKPPRYIYHTSSKENYEGINTNGLIPKEFSQSVEWSDRPNLFYPPAVFATTTVYGWRHRYDTKKNIWKIDTSKLNNKWWHDLNFFKIDTTGQYGSENAIMTFEPIPRKAIKCIE